MTLTIQKYLDLITAAFKDKPDFNAMVESGVSTSATVQDLLTEMIPLFDVDVAVGNQLDIIGMWVGFPREIPVPVPGVSFEWDNADPFIGWDYGVWEDPLSPSAVTVLPDSVYRTFIKAKIAANQWDGTTDGAYEVWDAAFPTISILILDGLDMSYRLAFVGTVIDSLTIAVIVGGYLPLKPEGVRITEYLFPVDDGPMFAWDLESPGLMAGWDEGSWPRVLLPT